jgi:CheY-like chemotaxis protein
MEQLDAATLGQQTVKLGLVTPAQLQEVFEEAGAKPTIEDLLQVLERKNILTRWQSERLLKGEVDGYWLGGYKLLYKISSGTFGRVYRAEDRSGRVVAIKVLRRRWSEDPQKIELFDREGKVGLTLKHPNIVEVLAVSQDPTSKQYYIVMEFVEGGNLREILAIRKTLTVPEALRIIDDATNGLAYAYSRGITHRDIKLTNLLISSRGEGKLVDFGLAQLFAAVARDIKEKVDRTVDYAGLERATSVPFGDVRSDMYFLGCVLYEALTGRSPLVITRDRHQRMAKSRFENVVPMSPEEVQAPPSVFALVETMMSLNPQRRFQTPSQLLDAVKTCRREAGAAGVSANGSGRSLFLAEKDERLQDLLREKFKELGYRVFIAGDPMRALDRFRQQPYDVLVINAKTTGEDGMMVYDRVLQEAEKKGQPCAGILLLAENQAKWASRVTARPRSGVLVHPVTFKQLSRKLRELLAVEQAVR